MFADLSVLRLSSEMARHATDRHALIAENIANADTPGFRAKDLPEFADVLQQAGGETDTLLRDTPMSPNGNSVSLEAESLMAARVQNDHAMALEIYRSSLSMLKTVIGKNL